MNPTPFAQGQTPTIADVLSLVEIVGLAECFLKSIGCYDLRALMPMQSKKKVISRFSVKCCHVIKFWLLSKYILLDRLSFSTTKTFQGRVSFMFYSYVKKAYVELAISQDP